MGEEWARQNGNGLVWVAGMMNLDGKIQAFEKRFTFYAWISITHD